MTLIASETESKYPIIPEGVYPAVCYAIYDLGNQFSEKYQNVLHKVLIAWEIPSERIDVEKEGLTMNLPRVVSKKYTLSLGERANLKKDLESWRGKSFTDEEKKGFDIHRLLGVSCMIQIIHVTKEGKTYAQISSILPLYKGMASLTPENDKIMYNISDGEPPKETPKWIVDMIHESSEWIANSKSSSETDDVPF